MNLQSTNLQKLGRTVVVTSGVGSVGNTTGALVLKYMDFIKTLENYFNLKYALQEKSNYNIEY